MLLSMVLTAGGAPTDSKMWLDRRVDVITVDCAI